MIVVICVFFKWGGFVMNFKIFENDYFFFFNFIFRVCFNLVSICCEGIVFLDLYFCIICGCLLISCVSWVWVSFLFKWVFWIECFILDEICFSGVGLCFLLSFWVFNEGLVFLFVLELNFLIVWIFVLVWIVVVIVFGLWVLVVFMGCLCIMIGV